MSINSIKCEEIISLCLECLGFGTVLGEPYDKSEYPKSNAFKSYVCKICNGTGKVKNEALL
jgi:hypothetical protein